jgi:hypothetical protein
MQVIYVYIDMDYVLGNIQIFSLMWQHLGMCQRKFDDPHQVNMSKNIPLDIWGNISICSYSLVHVNIHVHLLTK